MASLAAGLFSQDVAIGAWSGAFGQATDGGSATPAPPNSNTTVIGMPGAQPSNGTPTPAAPSGAPPAPAQPKGLGLETMAPMLIAVFVIMILMQVFGGRKEKKKRAEMLAGLKASDKVATVGGIVGTVVSVTDDDVLVRVEEGKIRFTKGAIQQVLSSGRARAEPALAEPKGEAQPVKV